MSVAPIVLPPGRTPVLSVVPMPSDSNQHGDIFGGWIMAQVDIAGGVIAARRARGRVATVAVNSFTFKQPVLIGDVVLFYASVAKVGRTSMTIALEAWRRHRHEDEHIMVTEATFTFVAVDDAGKSRAVLSDQIPGSSPRA